MECTGGLMGILQRLKWGDWRAFTREIAIVVIGVLVALAAGDVAENWNWQRKLSVGEAALRREAAENFQYAAEQVTVHPCVEAQLATARRRVLASQAVLHPAPVFSESDWQTYVYRMPSRIYVDTAWQALNSEGTTAYMDGPRRVKYAVTYRQLGDMADRTNQFDIRNARSLLLGEGIALDPATRAVLAGDLMETSGQSQVQSLAAAQVMASLRDLGQAPPAEAVDEFLSKYSGTIRFCKAHGLPMADWRTVLAAQEVEIPK